jgi:hypothetical protein
MLTTLSEDLAEWAREAIELYTRNAGEGAERMPEYFLPAYAFQKNAALGKDKKFIFTLETNSSVILKYYTEQQERQNTVVQMPEKLETKRYDMVAYDLVTDPKNGSFFALIEYKKDKYSAEDADKLRTVLSKLSAIPAGIIIGRVYGEEERKKSQKACENNGDMWREIEFHIDESNKKSWVFVATIQKK